MEISADHDDDDGGPVRGAAAGAGDRSGRRASPATGHRDRGRAARQPDADALHDPGGVSLPRPYAAVVLGPARGPRARTWRLAQHGQDYSAQSDPVIGEGFESGTFDVREKHSH